MKFMRSLYNEITKDLQPWLKPIAGTVVIPLTFVLMILVVPVVLSMLVTNYLLFKPFEFTWNKIKHIFVTK